MFEWFRKIQGRLSARKKAVVTFDDLAVTCLRPDDTKEEVTRLELAAIEIVTTDAGPFIEDLFWVLHGDGHVCVVPQEASGCTKLSARLQTLPNFNHQALIDAMCCTSNSRFPLWQRDSESPLNL